MQFNKKTETHKPLIATDSLHIYDIVVRNKNDILCATDKGLLHYNFSTKAHRLFGNNILEDPFLLMIDYHADFGVLCGSRDGFIYNYNEENSTFKTLYKDDLNAGIATIIPNKNKLWINTFNGYVHYNLTNKTLTRYSDKDGFSHNEANRFSAIKTDSLFIVGTLKGLNVFKLKDLIPESEETHLVITKIKRYDSSEARFKDTFNQVDFKVNPYLSLPVENRAIEIDFALDNIYARTNDYSFKYRLNDRDWVDLKQQNSIVFPNLAAGNYNLEIIALDFSGNQLGEPLQLKISSKEFFYKTWWFITSLSLIIIGILVYFLRQSQLRKQLQDQFSIDLIQSQENERKRIARELHDSVSQQLTLIKRKAQNNAQTEISELTNSTLEEVRHISRGLFPPLLKQLGLTESIEQLALDIDENNDIFVSTDITNIDAQFSEEESLHFYRFVQECMTNILKHAKAKALSIVIEQQKRSILVEIKDNGKGFDVSQAKLKNSLGLKTLEERVKILNGDLSILSKIGKGTTTKVTIHR